MSSILGFWVVAGIIMGIPFRVVGHWPWHAALLSGIGTALLVFFALALFLPFIDAF